MNSFHYALCVIITLFSCKPLSESESGAKSLDNFAAGSKVNDNDCSASPNHDINGKATSNYELSARNAASRNLLHYSVKADYGSGKLGLNEYKNLKEIARTALTAIPSDVQELFLSQKGEIVITEQANAICTNDMIEHFKGDKRNVKKAELDSLKEGLSGIAGCYIFVPERKGEEQLFEIYIDANESTIKHGLVRVFGYMLGEFYSRMMPRNKKATDYVMVAQEPEKSRAKKKALVTAFFKDIRGTEFEQNFSKYRSTETPNDLKLAFANWVFAESFDSYYCNNWAKPKVITLGTQCIWTFTSKSSNSIRPFIFNFLGERPTRTLPTL